jgi:hypothetical protein
MAAKSLRDLNQKYRGKPKKYAEGGRVRRPAAAPVPRPSDEDYLSILADRAVGAGEPVAELRSSEGRGFAPTPFQGEGFQRMSAMLRGDVEPTPGEQIGLNIVRGFTEGPAGIRAYHASPHLFDRFEPSQFRRASFFASNPERARIGAGSGVSEMIMETATKLPKQKMNIYEVDIDPSKIRGLQYTPTENEWFNNLPARIVGDSELEKIWRSRPKSVDINAWDDIYTPIQIGPREYLYTRKDAPPILSYEDAISTGRDIYGQRHSHYGYGADEKRAAEITRGRGMGGYLVNDEAGLSIGVIDPNIINITRRYAEGGLAELDQKYAEGGMVREPATAYDPDEIDRIVQEFAEGGEVEAPAETTINGQEHKLAYITDREAALLKARGGSGRMTKHGIRAYDEGPGEGPGSDNANSNSEASTQDAAAGNQGQGAGPTGAGAGGGPGQGNQGMSNADPEGTEQAANMNTAVAAQEAGRGFGIADTGGVAPTGFNAAPGIAEAIGALGRGEIGFGQALGYGVQSAMSPPGMQVGVNVDELGNQTPAVSVSALGVVGGLMGLATGIPGAGAIGGMIGNEIGKELGLDPTVMSYEPGVFNAPEPAPAYGAAYDQPFAHGGLAKLHAKYAGGGSVSTYDPRAVDQLAKQIEAQYV